MLLCFFFGRELMLDSVNHSEFLRELTLILSAPLFREKECLLKKVEGRERLLRRLESELYERKK